MKPKNSGTIPLIVIVALLAVLAIVSALTDHQTMISTITETTPTLDIPASVTQTIQAVLAATETARPTYTPIPPTATAIPPTATVLVLPDEFYIKGFQGGVQYYGLGCEAKTAVDLAAFYGLTLYEYNVQMALPISDNPDLGFVGDVNGDWGQIPPYAYGVHAAPIAAVLNDMGLEVEGGKGYTLEQLKESLAKSNPVIAWVVGHVEYSEPVDYTDQNGVTTIVAPYEHVVILTGYNETTVRYVDNGHWADVSYETFLTSWGVLGNMAVMHK